MLAIGYIQTCLSCTIHRAISGTGARAMVNFSSEHYPVTQCRPWAESIMTENSDPEQ